MNELWAEDKAEELSKSLNFVVRQSHLPACFELCFKNNFLVQTDVLSRDVKKYRYSLLSSCLTSHSSFLFSKRSFYSCWFVDFLLVLFGALECAIGAGSFISEVASSDNAELASYSRLSPKFIIFYACDSCCPASQICFNEVLIVTVFTSVIPKQRYEKKSRNSQPLSSKMRNPDMLQLLLVSCFPPPVQHIL